MGLLFGKIFQRRNIRIDKLCISSNIKALDEAIPKDIKNINVYDNFIKVECVYCQMILNIDELENHEYACIKKISKRKSIKCSICNGNISLLTFGEHQYKCHRKMTEMQINECIKFMLTPIQYKAVTYVNNNCKVNFIELKKEIMEHLSIDEYMYQKLIDNFNASNIVINFHPAKHLKYYIKDTKYRNQFETKISSGSNDISLRMKWEDNMFNSIYHDAKPYERCKYGALNITKDVYINEAVHYGDSYFIMKPCVKDRSTITFGDSSTYSQAFSLLYPELFLSNLPKEFLREMICNDYINYRHGRDYIECQIHGDILFYRDILACVGDSCHIKTDVGKELEKFCEKNNIILTWKEDILS
jgi:hypothetical protein